MTAVFSDDFFFFFDQSGVSSLTNQESVLFTLCFSTNLAHFEP